MTLSHTTPSPVPLDGALPVGPSAELRTWLAQVAEPADPGRRRDARSQRDGRRRSATGRRPRGPPRPHPPAAAWLDRDGRGRAAEAVALLPELDPEAYDAVRMVVAGGYYIHPRVRRLLRYTGQEPRTVRVDGVPEYLEEGLLERVMERGPIFREA